MTTPIREPPDARPGRAERVLAWWPEALVVLAALVLNLWNLTVNGWANTYYSAAVRSMTQSWRNFVFASFDPGGWVTVDKPPFGLWMEALSARILGFSSFSILLPSALAGATAVVLLLVTVRRVWGRPAGLVAGIVLATMPVAVAVSRSNNPDVYLVLAVVAAAFSVERAVATGRLRWMLLAGVLVGVGFLAKLGAALIVVPALWLAFVVGARLPWPRRLGHAALGGLMLLVVAGGWIAAVDLTPASSRPYIGGSTDGTAWDLVTGYNGLGRVTGESNGPGGGPGGGGGAPPGGGAAPGGGFGLATGGIDQFGGATGIARLFNNGMGDQVMWLAPLAAAAAIGGVVLVIRRRLSKPETASLICFAGWAATTYVTFAYASGIFHNYYVSLLAPAMAGLVGLGTGLVIRGGRLARVVAVAVVLLTGVLQLRLLDRVDALTWLRILVPVLVVAAAAALAVLAWRRGGAGRLAGAVIGLTAAAVLVAPTAWTLSSLGRAANGTFPDARPSTQATGGLGAPGRGGGPGGGLSQDLLAWLRDQRTTERWLIAVGSSQPASAAIIAGDSVMAIGGFSGSDDTMSASDLARLVRDGELRFVATGTGAGPGGSSAISAIVADACTEVPASTRGGSGSAIYDCRGRADAIEAAAPTARPGTGQQLPGGGPAGSGMEQLQQCLVEQGLGADPAAGPPDVSDPEVEAAFAACGMTAPGAGGMPPGQAP